MRRAHPAVLVLFLGVVILYSWPLVTDLAHLYPDNPDARVLTWAMLTAFRNLVTQPHALLQGSAFYPIGLSLTFSEPLFRRPSWPGRSTRSPATRCSPTT